MEALESKTNGLMDRIDELLKESEQDFPNLIASQDKMPSQSEDSSAPAMTSPNVNTNTSTWAFDNV